MMSGTGNSIIHLLGIHVFNLRSEIKKLKKAVKDTRSIIEESELKQLGDEEISDYVGRVKYSVYEAEDLIDDCLQQKNISKASSSSSSLLISILVNTFNCCITFDKFNKIERLRKRLEKLIAESIKYDLRVIVPVKDNHRHGYEHGHFCGGCADDKVLFGRESDKAIIIKKLLENDNYTEKSCLRVVSIVGMGGIGKTSLARYVYNHDKVKSHFHTRVWVSVPQTASYLDTTVRRILDGLSSSSGDDLGCGSNSHGADINHNMSILNASIQQKRYLIVLDDVWDEDVIKWQSLKNCLSNGVPGSSLLILTRNKMAAYLVSTTTLHELKPLCKDSAWELFRRYAFVKQVDDGDALKPFEEIGKIVSQRCNGVPLAIKCLGGLLRTKTTTQEWEDIMESDNWDLLEMEPILPALYFSYYSLPPILKLCLSYTAIFPKDYAIGKGSLIKLWMAQGFLGSATTKDRDPELVGAECFCELIMRSYFNPHKRNDHGEVTHIKVHDLVHDLTVSISGHSVVEIDGNDKTSKANKARHLSVIHHDLDSVARSVRKANHVTTLKLSECSVISGTVSPHLFSRLKFLRVLDLSYLRLDKIPNEIRKLTHLRYLNLSGTYIKCLPESVCDLPNLQTLTLNECEDLLKLPERLGNLNGLRHLEIQGTLKLEYFPQSIGKLTNLRTLSKFGIASSSRKGAEIGELKELNLLEGHLEIRGLKRVKSGSDAMKAELEKKKHLQSLYLDFECDLAQTPEVIKIMEDVLEALKPFPEMRSNIKVLNYIGSKYPSWMSPSV